MNFGEFSVFWLVFYVFVVFGLFFVKRLQRVPDVSKFFVVVWFLPIFCKILKRGFVDFSVFSVFRCF